MEHETTTPSKIYQRTGYPVGELLKHAALRARDSRVSVIVVLENGDEIEVQPS